MSWKSGSGLGSARAGRRPPCPTPGERLCRHPVNEGEKRLPRRRSDYAIQSLAMRIFALIPLAGLALLAAGAVDRKDIEFAHPGAKPLLLDLHIPEGAGPF